MEMCPVAESVCLSDQSQAVNGSYQDESGSVQKY
jgi:hypothetical protein